MTQPIVIYRLGSLGDTIVALPCFHAITRAHPGAERIVLTNFPVSAKAAPLEGILGGSGHPASAFGNVPASHPRRGGHRGGGRLESL